MKRAELIYDAKNIVLYTHDDHIGRFHSKGIFYELAMLEFIKEKNYQWLIIDAGANVGNHSVFFGLMTNCTGVMAFEPVKNNYSLLRRNIIENRLENKVFCHPHGLSHRTMQMAAEEKSDNMGMCRLIEGAGIEVKPLDDCLDKEMPVSMIKIDCEGMEQKVLGGAMRILKRWQPDLFVEAATQEGKKSLDAILRPLGYACLQMFNATPTWYYSVRKK